MVVYFQIVNDMFKNGRLAVGNTARMRVIPSRGHKVTARFLIEVCGLKTSDFLTSLDQEGQARWQKWMDKKKRQGITSGILGERVMEEMISDLSLEVSDVVWDYLGNKRSMHEPDVTVLLKEVSAGYVKPDNEL